MANVPARGLPDSDAELVRLAASGHAPAFARIVRLHHADVVRVCLLITGDIELARTAVADTWPIALRRIARLEDPGRLGPWLCAIAADEARQAQRRPDILTSRREPGALDAALLPGTPDWPGDRELAGALAALAAQDRVLLALRVTGGLDTTELARAVQSSRTAVEARLERLLDRLATTLGDTAIGAADRRARLERRLRALASVPVRPVDVDAVAWVARAEIAVGRDHLVSVVVAAILAVIVVATLDIVAAGVAGNPTWLVTRAVPGPSATAPASPGGDGSPGIR